ncbi:glycosyltransferase family 51 protein, partial [Micromonas pusilla CCMP1545]
TIIYDVRGRVVATLSSEAVKLKDVSPAVWQAVVASEDHRFFKHKGVDVRGLTRAIGSMGKMGGGSTITQQLVKNLVLCQDRTISRKISEILLSLKVETRLTKEELLEAYLNNVYWGHGVYGIAGAAAAYFGKSPAELDVGESALLAALLPAPEALSPYANPAGAKRVRNQNLAAMARHGYLTEPAAKTLMNTPLGRGGAAPYRAPFFVSEVLFHLKTLFEGQDVLSTGGLKVHTTMDLALQEKAEQLTLEDGMVMMRGEDKGEAAIVAIDPATGAVRVLIGGREYSQSPYNRAVLSKRSAGSTFKPFVYLTALQEGVVNPSTLLQDEEIVFEVPDGEEPTYTPLNYSRKFKGTVSLRDCLVESLNVPTVKVAEMTGIDKIIEMSSKLGITSTLPNALSLALGSCETTPLEMTVAYASIAAGGIYSKPHLITKVRDRTGAVVYRHKGRRKLVANRAACAALHGMLRAAVTRGTGRSAAVGWPAEKVAGKTGTSDDYRDAWFAGYTPQLACVVWCGRDDNSSLPGTGSECAAPLWAKFMRAA